MSEPQARKGLLIKGIGGLYTVRGEDGQAYVLRARGIFRKRRVTPLVGDEVLFSPGRGEEHGWVEDILPRRNALVRPPVANVAHLALVIAPEPEPDMLLVDTLLVFAFSQDIAPLIVVTKTDLAGSAELAARLHAEYAQSGVPVLETSARDGCGLSRVRDALMGGVACVAGQSGVGKSTLLNAVAGLSLETGEISRRIARGRNTTRTTELLEADGLRVLDTPGFSLLTLRADLEPIHLKDQYPDFAPYEGECRFAPCYHRSEPDCAVLNAVRTGALSAERVARYHALLKQADETWKQRYE